jgi:outer membrane lipoprotein-sorting protein
MRSETPCDAIRPDLSAFIDGELRPERRAEIESHLETCAGCRREEASLRAVRRLVRVQLVEDVPDLAPAIMARLSPQQTRRHEPWRERFRVAAVGAAAAALFVWGVSLPFDTAPGDIAAASEITEGVRAAARQLDSYRATYSIVERGWHPAVPVRRMTADVDFRAPEELRLEVRDLTEYPSPQWPPNDITLIATGERWWIEEPSSCPAVALPDCAAPTTWAGVIERRVVTHRQPFDGTSPLPTDIVLPLETLAADEGFSVLARTTVAGQPAYRLGLDYRHALPLIGALQAGGAWRDFHPLDPVDVWVDAETWFPLRFEVRTGTSDDRALWASRRDLDDRAGSLLLRVMATEFSEPDRFSSDTFDVPASGLRRDGGFREVSGVLGDLQPSYDAGLRAYRAGRTDDGREIVALARGMSYLKVIRGRGGLSATALEAGEEIALPGGGYAYYLPASESLGRRVELATGQHLIQLETNLTRDALLRVADSLDASARRAPRVIEKSSGLVLVRTRPERAFDRLEFARSPGYLPEGYDAVSASIGRTRDDVRSLTLYLRRPEGEFDGLGMRLVQSHPVAFLPPSSEEFVEVRIGDLLGRWSAERGELEWIDGKTYRAVAVPSTDLYTALRIAAGLR